MEEQGGPPAETKLTRAKRQWAREKRLLTGTTAEPALARLPPGQRLTRDWPVLDLGAQPAVASERFRLAIDGAVRRPIVLTLPEFMALAQQEVVSDIHCVTQWSRFDNTWRGVSGATLVDLVEPEPTVRHVMLHGADGYETNLGLGQFVAPDALVAHSWQGMPIPREHGGPVRVVVPRLYFWKSAKWICRIELMRADRPGYWERNGYHNNADPWREERYG